MQNNYQNYVFEKIFERTKEFKYHFFEKIKYSLKLTVISILKIKRKKFNFFSRVINTNHSNNYFTYYMK
jgi:hypothetical protein